MYSIKNKIISDQELLALLPLSPKGAAVKEALIRQIQNILAERDARKLLICGPCSADNEQAFYTYLSKIKALSLELKDQLLIVPRLYTSKPRTRGDSYKGLIYHPDPQSNQVDIQKGICRARSMFVTALEQFEMGCADEILYPELFPYFEDVLSYAVIGSRTAESPYHRFLGSALNVAVGIKNPMSGNLNALAASVYSCQISNEFFLKGCQVRSGGNPYAHAVLRGYVDHAGRNHPNFGREHLLSVYTKLQEYDIMNTSVIIDTNHSNSNKDYRRQADVVRQSIAVVQEDAVLNRFVKGFMTESYLLEGSQQTGGTQNGKSYTDGCIGFEETVRLAREIAETIK